MKEDRPLFRAGTIKSFKKADNGDLQLEVLGVVFSDPDGEGEVFRDLYGDFFMPPVEMDGKIIGTDYKLGEKREDAKWMYPGKTVPVLWDHGLDKNVGDVVLGEAEFRGVSEEGLEFLITIEKARAREYQKLVEALYEEGFLGVSSQTLPSMASVDWSSGAIESWPIVEVSLTPTPADPRTVRKVQAVAKSIGVNLDLEVKDMGKAQQKDNPQREEVNSEVEETATEKATPVTAKVKAALDVVDSEMDKIEADAAYAQLARRLDVIEARLDDVLKSLRDFQSKSEEDRQVTEQQIKALTDDIGTALAVFAEELGRKMASFVAVEAKAAAFEMSSAEVNAGKAVAQKRNNGYRNRALPKDWPGVS